MKLLTLFILLALAGCGNPTEPLGKVKTDNPGIKVEHLLTIDGCKVYRFTTENETGVVTPHFVTICSKAETTTTQQVSCGRACTREEAIKALPGMR